jgi:hypothetical protein
MRTALCLLFALLAGCATSMPAERSAWLASNTESEWAPLVRESSIVPGMPRDALLASWGHPGSASRVVTTKASDVWMYWYNHAEVYLTNGRVSSIWHR